ncbi:MAG: CRISPR system precrRNA processing endoribonuclease RAMP protein Cas6 [Saprospiraceae bacterium]|nr:CRISPR system precrRNA processing endoribonuclease RAMP protein Cas6 [Saprospiraceae bacterium]
MLDFLQNISLTTYDITLKVETGGFLPGFTGSTLRGALGHALWRYNCRDYKRNVRPFSCGESCSCVVGRLWLPRGQFPQGYNNRYQNAPKPFSLTAPYAPEPQLYKKGDTLKWSLTLMGDVNREFFRRILPAIEEAVQKLGSQRLVFRIEQLSIVSETPTLAITDDDVLLEMTILTPLSIYEREKLPEELRFGLIIKHLLERLRNLAYLYGQAQWADDDMILAYSARAEHEVQVQKQVLREVNIPREADKNPIVGYLGKVTYTGRWQTWLSLLLLAEQINLGRMTDMGCGHIHFSTK